MISLTELLLEQKSLEQGLTHKMMVERLRLVTDSQIMHRNTGKQFLHANLTEKHTES